LIIASVFQSLKYDSELNIDMVRHMLLNTYRMYRNKFSKEYGELVICNDGGRYWRKDIFPQYKSNRSKNQKKSKIDWDNVHEIMNTIHDEIKTTFPYKNIKIYSIEADDIIAVLCQKYHQDEKVLIVSSDKDFQQLQRFLNVKQYSPLKKKFIVCENPEVFLVEHILGGDSSDGIPNILSDDDTFVDPNKRQKPCGKKTISKMKNELQTWTNSENWNRNQNLIDFQMIPEVIQDTIIEEYNKEIMGKRSNILSYFIEYKMKKLMDHIEEF
jgi:5'-3' exonuclease